MVLILVLVQAVCNAAAQFFATFVRYFAEEVQGKDKEVIGEPCDCNDDILAMARMLLGNDYSPGGDLAVRTSVNLALDGIHEHCCWRGGQGHGVLMLSDGVLVPLMRDTSSGSTCTSRSSLSRRSATTRWLST